MNKILFSSILSVAALTVNAQNAYDAGNLTQTDLNGTARYVGMGGALNALGGDLSAMCSNPASAGLYRKADVGFTLSGLFAAEDYKAVPNYGGSRMSIDNAGILFAFQTDDSGVGLQFINVGLNYKKSRNFFGNSNVDVMHLNNTFSQTFQIADLADYAYHYNKFYNSDWGILPDISASSDTHDGILMEYPDEPIEKVDAGNRPIVDEDGRVIMSYYDGVAAKNAFYAKHSVGGVTEADLSVSLNTSDRFYFGLSLGIYNVDYERQSFYKENGVDGNAYDFTNWYRTTGTGVDLKFGAIIRPFEDSPFRFGISLQTPTWYSLTDANGSTLYMNNKYVHEIISDDYDYKFRTPIRLNFSLGHTIGNKLALGAEYEFANFKYGRYGSKTYLDESYIRDINEYCINTTLKAQHTIKVGAEFKPTSSLALRLGYNYLTSAYDKSGYKTILYYEPATDTDFTNWGGINRITAGFGFNWKGGYLDLAYQFQSQKGDFYAFDDAGLKPTTIKDNRSQLIATIGFRF